MMDESCFLSGARLSRFIPLFALALGVARGRIVLIQPVLLYVIHNCGGEEVLHGQPTAQEKPYFRGRNIVLDELRDEVDVVSPSCEAVGRLVHARPRALDDEGTVPSEYVIELNRVMPVSLHAVNRHRTEDLHRHMTIPRVRSSC